MDRPRVQSVEGITRHSGLRVTRNSYHDNDFRYHDNAWRYHDNANLSYSIGLSDILATCTNERRATEK